MYTTQKLTFLSKYLAEITMRLCLFCIIDINACAIHQYNTSLRTTGTIT